MTEALLPVSDGATVKAERRQLCATHGSLLANTVPDSVVCDQQLEVWSEGGEVDCVAGNSQWVVTET